MPKVECFNQVANLLFQFHFPARTGYRYLKVEVLDRSDFLRQQQTVPPVQNFAGSSGQVALLTR